MAECPEETGEERRKKKMPGVFWSFRVSIHVGMSWYKWVGCHISKIDTLACHIGKKGINE
jgi:hypothetical protein